MKEITEEEWDKLPEEEKNNFTGSVKWKHGSQFYYQNGQLHRIDGPAYIKSNDYKEYWINGKQVSKEGQELYYFLMKFKGLV